MDSISVKAVRSDIVYKEIMEAPKEKKDDMYRYDLIKHYLKKTGKSIIEATLTPSKEILNETWDFWNIGLKNGAN